MEQRDQQTRDRALSKFPTAVGHEGHRRSPQRDRTCRVDRQGEHEARSKEIIGEHGWPGRTLVGDDAASVGVAASSQHTDRTANFQKKALELMEAMPVRTRSTSGTSRT